MVVAGASVAALVVAAVAAAPVAMAPLVVAPVTPLAYISLCEIVLETLSSSLLNLMEFLVEFPLCNPFVISHSVLDSL